MKDPEKAPARPQRKHRGSIRSRRRVNYLLAAFTAALADPVMREQVALVGNLFPRRRGGKVTTEQLAWALAARHPTTGKLLRARVNAGTRQEGEFRVSNVCHGLDVTLSVAKSVSVAALLLHDDTVLKASMDAMRHTAHWLTGQMDRRLRRGGQNATVATGKSAAFVLPEKTGRDGQPHLHSHVVLPNLTSFEEGGRKKFCAGHFRRITRLATTAQKRLNRQIFQRLHKSGYAVYLKDGVCHLPSVSAELCDRLSPLRAKLAAEGNEAPLHARRTGSVAARHRENEYLRVRSKKELRTLAQWQRQWVHDLPADLIKSSAAHYRTHRMRAQEAGVPGPLQRDLIPVDQTAVELPVAAHRASPASDDVLDHREISSAPFRQLGASTRKWAESELSPELRRLPVEIDYHCPEEMRHLVERTEALRTLLRLIFPRLIVHQKFTAADNSSFVVTGPAGASEDVNRLVPAVARALEAELSQADIQANWPSVLRWLHLELANRPEEPVVSAPRIRTRHTKPAPLPDPPRIDPPPPPISVTPQPAPAPAASPEIELLP